MLKRIIIVILILVVIGLYFAPEITKSILSTTGKATVDTAKKITGKIVESETFNETKETVKEKISGKLTIE